MTSRIRNWTWLTALVAVAGCGGSRTPPPTEPPAVNELVRLAAAGELDQERLYCAASWLAEGVAVNNALSDGRASERSTDYAREGAREAARQAEHAVAVRGRAGGAPGAAFYLSYVEDLMTATRASGVRGAPRENRAAGPSNAARELFEEYTSLWALLMSTPDLAAEHQARVAEIDELEPEMMEAYTQSLLYVYHQPALSCGAPRS